MRKDGILSGVQLSGGRGGRYVGYACECRISCKFSELISVEDDERHGLPPNSALASILPLLSR